MASLLILVFVSIVLVTAILGQGAHLKNTHNNIISNNSVIDYTNDIGTGGSTLRCVTNRVDCCSFDNKTRVDWFTPSGEVVDDMHFIRIWTGLGRAEGSVHIFRTSSTSVASVQEGLYHCIIPAANGDISTLYVGIYIRDNIDGIPTISGITYNQLSPEMFTLTCTSIGGPATIVTWALNGSVITYDANHVLTQTVVNTRTAEYNNTLTVTGKEPGNYQCTVSNARGSDTSQFNVLVEGPDPDPVFFQLQMGPMERCTMWDFERAERVEKDVRKGIAKALGEACQYEFPLNHIKTGKISCWNSPTEFTYRSTIIGTVSHNSTELLELLREWVQSEPVLQIHLFQVRVVSTCLPEISSHSDPECSASTDSSLPFVNSLLSTCVQSCIDLLV